VRVLVNGNVVTPGPVTWDRELKLLSLPVPSAELQLRSGVRAFTFIARNITVPRSGIANVQVQAKFQFLDVPILSFLGSAAYIGDRTLAVKLVNLD
jgi:hypothetical protein